MRLRRSRLKEFSHCQMVMRKNNEGGTYPEYESPTPFKAEEWAAGGKLQMEMYGQRLPNIRNLRLNGKYKEISGKNGKLSYQIENGPTITVNDGICINSEEPDYRVIAIYPYRFLTLEVERI